MNSIKKVIVLLLSTICIINLYAQDSLYLIASFIGSSEEKSITNAGGLGDINNDGFNDFFIHLRNSNYFNIYLGTDSINTKDKIVVNKSELTNINYIIPLRDINNDGFDDIYFNGKIGTVFPEFKSYLLLGNSNIENSKIMEVTFPGTPISTGDLNGDGYKDLITINPSNFDELTGSPSEYDSMGYVYLHLGSDSISFIPNFTFSSGEFRDGYGTYADISSDINNDGFNDLLVIAPFLTVSNTPKCYLYLGSSTIKTEPDLTFEIPSESLLQIVGDVNGDEFSDFIITGNDSSSPGNKFSRIYFGSAAFDAKEYIDFKADAENTNFGEGFGGINDINNDGFGDFAITIKNYINNSGQMVGKLNIYFGNSIIDTIPAFSIEGENHWGEFGKKVGSLGDINNDGYNEFYALAPNYPDYEHPLGKLYIYSMKDFIVGVKEELFQTEPFFELLQNYPNPFNPSTKIVYTIPNVGDAKFASGTNNLQLIIYDILGREVETLVNEAKQPGRYTVQFDGSNLTSGIYFVKMKVKGFKATKKIVLAK